MVKRAAQVEGDERLREAAIRGDVEFLRQECWSNSSVSVGSNNNNNNNNNNKPHDDDGDGDECLLTVFPKRDPYDQYYGNIFHIAAMAQQEKFIRAAVAVDDDKKLLGVEVIQQLLCQSMSESIHETPLHVAAYKGNAEIVKMFINAFITSNSSSSTSSFASGAPTTTRTPPWLLTGRGKQTPCHMALITGKEECALQMLKMDMVSLPNMLNEDESSLLYSAISGGQYKAAMHILMNCPPNSSFSCSGINGYHALHVVPQSFSPDEGQEICRRLLETKPELITQSNKIGQSIFHSWAEYGKKWSFECFLNASDIIPDVRRKFIDLISTNDVDGMNPLHELSRYKRPNDIEIVQLGKLLIDTYKSISTERQSPWLVKDDKGNTPLDYAIAQGNEEFAKMILLEDKNALKYSTENVLFMAIENKVHEEVLIKILEIVGERKDLNHLLTNEEKLTVLHLSPKCNEVFLKRLLEGHTELIGRVDKSGNPILHYWVKIGQLWSFDCVFKKKIIGLQQRSQLLNQIFLNDGKNDSAFHVAASCTNPEIQQVVQILVEAHHEIFSMGIHSVMNICHKNIDGEGPIHLAIRCQQDESIALYLLSLYEKQHVPLEKLLDLYTPEQHKILFLAVQKNFSKVVKMILGRLNKESWTNYAKDSSTGQNVLHIASSCTDKELGKWLVEKAYEFIKEPDKNEITPLDQASDVGAAWILEAMLERDDSAFNNAPSAWIRASEKGHVSVINTFIEYCPEKFSDHCFDHQDSPLHHIKLRNIVRYEEFMKMHHMKDLINLKDSTGATPLHKALENENILLAEVLLNMDNIKYNIKNTQGKTARDLLVQLCKDNQKWDKMCKSIGFDPNLRTSYFQRKTDLLDVRNTLSVVAALLATITFTAGFTLPGGFDQNNGEAMLANKAAFIVFLISDTLALCFSMLVLICLIWSMVFEHHKSLFLIDRSVLLIKASIYLTLLAFVTGVYIVVSPKSMWVAILIIAVCSLVGISAKMTFLYKVFLHIDSFVNKVYTDSIHLMEMSIPLLSNHGEISNQGRPSNNEDLV